MSDNDWHDKHIGHTPKKNLEEEFEEEGMLARWKRLHEDDDDNDSFERSNN